MALVVKLSRCDVVLDTKLNEVLYVNNSSKFWDLGMKSLAGGCQMEGCFRYLKRFWIARPGPGESRPARSRYGLEAGLG
jgi:hypothetical protein